ELVARHRRPEPPPAHHDAAVGRRRLEQPLHVSDRRRGRAGRLCDRRRRGEYSLQHARRGGDREVARAPPRRNETRCYQGRVRFVYFRPISAACWLAGPIITPSLIMSTTLSAFMELRKKILAALVAANTLSRAACICGGIAPPGPFFTPSEKAMSPGP